MHPDTSRRSERAGELLRASIFHTPRNPFRQRRALAYYADGGLLIRDGRVAGCGDYRELYAAHPQAVVRDWRGGFLLPGLIDTHTHFPQLRIVGAMGLSLLDWLDRRALPEEARMADERGARETAGLFLDALASHGTTTALVFGSHFRAATAALFEQAESRGLRIVSGMVLSDRLLRPELHQSADAAYRAGSDLIRCFHGRGLLRYAVTPRFALSASEAILEVCQTLCREHPAVLFQSHLNENAAEIAEVARLFPWAQDYLAVYERYGLVGPGAVLAHDVHPTPSELERLAAAGAAVAHCPSSNAALGSGIFPMRRHIDAGVRCSLGTDVGAGTTFSILQEALQAYLVQRIAPQPALLGPEHLLYLATRAGAEALGLERETGDFQPDKSADLVYLRPLTGSPLAAAIERADDSESVLGSLFTLAGQDAIRHVRVAGKTVYGDAEPEHFRG